MSRVNKTIRLNGRETEISVRRSTRAQRIAIRIGVPHNKPELVLPDGVSEQEGIAFLRSKQNWILQKVDEAPNGIPFTDGMQLPLHGVSHDVIHRPLDRRGVWRKGTEIHVSGNAEHFARRLTDWLRREAKETISGLAKEKSAALDRNIKRITIRDQSSRWGSCSYDGALSFNWRLILAPPDILDYVVAHEVAHLVELNHSKAFWRLVDQLTPHARRGRQWLKSNGHELHLYGRN